MGMRRSRAEQRAFHYMEDHCEVIDPLHTPDGYGGWINNNDGDTMYSGPCYASPGNMWPFEIPEAASRQGRGDLIFYIPRDIEGMTVETVIRHMDHEYEVIGYAPLSTAAASTIITARRMTL